MDTKRFAFIFFACFALIASSTAPWITHGRLPWNDGCVVWVFDVGQGDSIFLDCPEAQVLIDGGPSEQIIEHLSVVMPFWDRSIDVVINTHPHADHTTGLISVLDRYDVGEVWVSGQTYSTQVFARFDELSSNKQRIVSAGDTLSVGEGITLTVLWPAQSLLEQRLDDPNSGSIVTLLEAPERSLLLTGDIGVHEERMLIDRLSDIDVLKVGHQGSLTSSDPTFLTAINPELAIIPVGENSYGHPHPIVLDRFERLGIPVLRTDLHGSVRVDIF